MNMKPIYDEEYMYVLCMYFIALGLNHGSVVLEG